MIYYILIQLLYCGVQRVVTMVHAMSGVNMPNPYRGNASETFWQYAIKFVDLLNKMLYHHEIHTLLLA